MWEEIWKRNRNIQLVTTEDEKDSFPIPFFLSFYENGLSGSILPSHFRQQDLRYSQFVEGALNTIPCIGN